MTAKQYIDEVKLRLPRTLVEQYLNDARLLTLLNRARQRAQQATIGVYPERYGKVELIPLAESSLDVTLSIDDTIHGTSELNAYSFPLPATLIKCIHLNLHFELDGVTYRRECRNATKQELYGVVTHNWNKPTTVSPLYVIEKKISDESAGRGTGDWCYILGLQYGNSQTLFDVAENIKVELWYTSALNDLTFAATSQGKAVDEDTVLPPSNEEMVIYTTIMYALQSTSVITEESNDKFIDLYKTSIQNIYDMERGMAVKHIPSQQGFPE